MTKMEWSGNRARARALEEDTYWGQRCEMDGTSRRNTATGKCVECERYRRAIQTGRVEGIDNRTEAQKKGMPARPVSAKWNRGEWSEEMRQEHAAAIKRGLARRFKAATIQTELKSPSSPKELV